MNVLVTGANGFSGTHLLRLLYSKGIRVFTHGPERGILGEHFNTPLHNLSALTEVVKTAEPDFVFHLAGIATASNFSDFYYVNTLYAANLLKALEIANREDSPVLLVGTSAEYGWVDSHQLPLTEETLARPYSHYGISKLAQTLMGQVLARGGRNFVIVRPFNIIGRGMGDHLSVKNFATQVAEVMLGRHPRSIYVGNLSSSRDFVDVEETVQIYWDILQNPKAYGEVINICSGKATLLKDILQKIIALSGQSIAIHEDSALIKDIDIPIHYGSPEKLRSIVGKTLSKGLDTTIKEILDEAVANLTGENFEKSSFPERNFKP